MTTAVETAKLPWWKEPTNDQWIAWWAAWLGWTLDAFDFTVFLLIMVPISQDFGVPLTAVAFVLAGQKLEAFVSRDLGSLVSLGKYSTVGSLMGFLGGKNIFIEGYFARLMYSSL
jgi:hypothetical protein